MPYKRSSSPPPFRVARSNTGLGLFAVEPIKKGKRIIEYWGKRIATKDADDVNSKYLFELNSRWTIDGANRKNVARYINHSCKPNAESDVIRSKVIIRAIKTIRPGDEITYDYGANYFETFIKPKGCRCASCVEKRREKRRAQRLRAKRALRRKLKS